MDDKGKETRQEVFKHSAAIHIENNITFVQRRAFNPSMWPLLSSPFKYFFVFSCPYTLSPDDAEALYARTGSVDEWGDLWPHSSQVRINTLGTEHVPLARALASYASKGLCTCYVLVAS